MMTLEPLSAGLMIICLLETRFFKAVRSEGLRLWKSDLSVGRSLSAELLAVMKLAKVGGG